MNPDKNFVPQRARVTEGANGTRRFLCTCGQWVAKDYEGCTILHPLTVQRGERFVLPKNPRSFGQQTQTARMKRRRLEDQRAEAEAAGEKVKVWNINQTLRLLFDNPDFPRGTPQTLEIKAQVMVECRCGALVLVNPLK